MTDRIEPGIAVPGHLVGRDAEMRLLREVLEECTRSRSRVVGIRGESGIGKTRLLDELTALAESQDHLVLSGSASEMERDLPLSVFVDALDEYLEGLEPGRFGALDEDVRVELGQAFPSLSSLAVDLQPAGLHERYRSHRAVRVLLEWLAETTTVVLVLDDFHWADSASVELLGALLRRPPSAAVLIALAFRPRQLAERLSAELERALRSQTLIQVELDELSLDESRQLLGETIDHADMAVIHEESGGNPFYLQQIARSFDAARSAAIPASEVSLTDFGVPAAVVSSLNEELASLSTTGRLVLEGAAVAGDPFEPELAAAAAAVSESTALDGVDELLRLDLVKTTEVPRRFRFRHPLVRRAAYEATAGAWRLSAHERCAEALAARGATAAALAHHVESSARAGDLAAVAVLEEAGRAALRLAPATAARWFAGALRLMPQNAPHEQRVDLHLAGARALTAAGYFSESHSTLLDALALIGDCSDGLRAKSIRACAATESNLGLHEQARERLVGTIATLPPELPEAVALRIDLAMNGFWRSDFKAMQESAESAANAARRLGNAPLTAAAASVLALADSIMGAAGRAELAHSEAKDLVASLSDEELAGQLDAAAWLAGAELYLDRYSEADLHAERALAVGRASGQGELFLVLVQILGRVWFVRGRLAEASELLDEGIEAARLLRNDQALVWNLFNRSVVALAVGDLELALATARESVDLSSGLAQGFHSAWAGVRLAGVFLELGQPELAVELLRDCAGGEEMVLIPGSWRGYCLDLFTRCWLELDRPMEARQAAECAQAWATMVSLPLATAWADRAAAAVSLHAGETEEAAEGALASASDADEAGAPVEAALSRILAGRALAEAGQSDRAVVELQHAAAELDACGALRYRDHAERELRKLGHRVHRRSRPGTSTSIGIESLTERELQVARLVVDRRTNSEIAAELFLSQKTVESHLRNIFHKMNVFSRVELARTVELAESRASWVSS